MYLGIKNIDELIKTAAQFTLTQIFQQLKKKLEKQQRELSLAEFHRLVEIDPTYQGGGEQGSYTHWVLRQFLNDPKVLTEDSEKIQEHLTIFDKIKNRLNKKDINQYGSDADLFEVVSPYMEEDLTSKRQLNREKSQDYETIYQDPSWTIYSPNTWEASVKLGRKSNWCTAADSEEGEEYFHYYNNQGPLFILINHDYDDEKYQFHFESGQYVDINDREIDLEQFFNEEASSGVAEWYIDMANIDIYDVNIEESISGIVNEYYLEADLSKQISKDFLYEIFDKGVNFLKQIDFENLMVQLGFSKNDYVNAENFNYQLAYNILVDKFETNFNAINDHLGYLDIFLYPSSDNAIIELNEDILMIHFLGSVISHYRIDYDDLVDKGLVPSDLEPILKSEIVESYREQIAMQKEKEYEEAGQMKLFDDAEYIEYIEDREDRVAFVNIENIDELIKIGEKYMKPTSAMKEFFNKRTLEHIDRVKKYCKKIHDYYKDQFEGIIERGEAHDDSKWKDPEIVPYIYITWDYKCKDDDVSFEIPDHIRDLMNDATKHHINTNRHHPEFHSPEKGEINRENRDEVPDVIIDATKMDNLDVAEMVADWMAMSEEKGNSPFDWADKNVNKRWRFNTEQEYIIYDILNNIWEKEM